MRNIQFDGQHSNQGCDVISLEPNIAYLVEIKGCSISRADAKDAITQLAFTDKWLKQNYAQIDGWGAYNSRKIIKVFLHHRCRRSCNMLGHILFKQKNIFRPNARLPQWREVINFARRAGLLH
jgi:hypothetical protein